ncbi:rCG41548 [Rattus norvegicus]|uniref:RCG41548 n=1 Tax=Rattus norvegicus TaxID=10116 RepID=A6IHZ5_RAT|nr:rCG59217 [Rattus norvegicus]EDM01293.1 rCG41548 [Rattus norvegicus]
MLSVLNSRDGATRLEGEVLQSASYCTRADSPGRAM